MKTKTIGLALTSVFAICLAVAALVPSLRERARAMFLHSENELLASAEGDLLNDGTFAKVIKFRSGENLYVEVLKVKDNGDTSVVERILLPDKHDGLFNFQGHVTRLAIADIDNDGKFELLAPTFDNQLVPHLNVFHYNPAIGQFELYQPGAK